MAYNDSYHQEEMVLRSVISWHHSIATSLFNRGLAEASELSTPVRRELPAGRSLKI